MCLQEESCSSTSEADHREIKRLNKEISALHKEKKTLQLELENHSGSEQVN